MRGLISQTPRQVESYSFQFMTPFHETWPLRMLACLIIGGWSSFSSFLVLGLMFFMVQNVCLITIFGMILLVLNHCNVVLDHPPRSLNLNKIIIRERLNILNLYDSSLFETTLH